MASAQPRPFGDLLRRYRVAAGLTQEELAEAAGLSRRAIGALETGVRRLPHRDTVSLLVKALRLTPAEQSLLESAARQRLPGSGLQSSPGPTIGGAGQALRMEHPGAPLVGRQQELLALQWHLAGEGPPLLTLAGEPGIGKTRLLEEAARRAAEQGWTVLAGGCHRRSGQEPYAPFVSILARFLAGRSPAQQRLDLVSCSWLVRLLPELAESAVVPAPSWTMPAEQERRLVFAAVARLLANVAGPLGTLLVVDDLQWAGADALDLMACLLRESAGLSLRILGAYRDSDVRPGEPLALLVRDLAREELASRTLPLPLLPRPEAMALLDTLLAAHAQPSPDLVDMVLDRAGGLPFFLVSYAQELRLGVSILQTAADAHSSGSNFAVPWSAAESIRQRIAVLSPPAQQVLAIAAVFGRRVSRAALLWVARSLDYGEEAALAALEEATHARLLIELAASRTAADDDASGYGFTHDLIRETVVADLSVGRRAMLHQRVGEALEELPAAARRRHASALAWHFAEGEAFARALPYALQAGDQAEAHYAHIEAEQQYRLARAAARALGDQAREAEALEKLAEALTGLGRSEENLAALDAAAAIRDAAGDVDRLAWDTAQMTRAFSLLGQSARGLERLRAVLAAIGAAADHDTAEHGAGDHAPADADTLEAVADRAARRISPRSAAFVYLSLTIHLGFLERYQEAIPFANQAIAYARTARDRQLQAHAEAFLGNMLMSVGQLDQAQAAFEAAQSSAQEARNLDALYLACGNLGEIHQQRGDLDRAERSFARALDAAEQQGLADPVAQCLCHLGAVAFLRGAWDQAATHYERAAAAIGSLGFVPTSALVALMRGTLHLAQGHIAQAYASLEAVIASDADGDGGGNPALRAAHAALAEHELVLGHPSAARERLLPLLVRAGTPVATDAVAHIPLLAWAEADIGNIEQAEALAADSQSQAFAWQQRLALADALRVTAMLGARQGRWDAAEGALDECLSIARSLPYPYAEAKALYVAGQMRAARGEMERAREHYAAALVILRRLGERLYAEHIERALAAL